MPKAAFPTIPNLGAMSDFIGAFDVPSKVTDYVYRCRFSHCWNGIATRHSDTMDCKFFVDGKGVILGLAHPAFVAFRERAGRNLTDREASYIAGCDGARSLVRETLGMGFPGGTYRQLFYVADIDGTGPPVNGGAMGGHGSD